MKKRSLAVLFVAAYVAACASEESTRADVVTGGRGTTDPRVAASGTRSGPVSAADARASWERDIAGGAAGTSAGDRVFFAVDRTELSPEAQETLRRQAEWLRRYSNLNVTIEGHADEHGTREYNLGLGDRRATATRNFLVAAGIPAQRIRTVTYGKERPAVIGSNEEAYAKNRRAVTTID
jgi:peptidoglycan-associated lipoprotein